jgi:hypothetical protein
MTDQPAATVIRNPVVSTYIIPVEVPGKTTELVTLKQMTEAMQKLRAQFSAFMQYDDEPSGAWTDDRYFAVARFTMLGGVIFVVVDLPETGDPAYQVIIVSDDGGPVNSLHGQIVSAFDYAGAIAFAGQYAAENQF